MCRRFGNTSGFQQPTNEIGILQPPENDSMRKLLAFMTILWLAVLFRLTVFRNGCFSNGFFSGRVEWDAFANYLRLARSGNWWNFSYLFFGNLIWFFPVGILIKLRGGRLRRAVLAGFLLSLGSETAQFALGSGISELDDLILNTLGGLLGYLGTSLFLARFSKRTQ